MVDVDRHAVCAARARALAPAGGADEQGSAVLGGGAIPNHILLPYEQYSHILNTMVTDLAGESILDYLLKNNIAAKI